MSRWRIILPLVVLAVPSGYAQDLLTLDQALQAALQRNFLIASAKNEADVARLNNTPGNAGMLPKVAASGTAGGSISNIDQKMSSGSTAHYPDDTTTTLSPSVTLTWTLFDGLKMFATKARLRRLQQIGELNYKDTVQTVVAGVINAYYDIVSAAQQLSGLNKAIEVSQQRVTITQKQFQVGTISEVDLLQAKVDLNERRSALLAQEDLITQKKTALNTMLGRAADVDFRTVDSIAFVAETHLRPTAELDSGNYQLAAAERSVAVAGFARREARAQLLPTLSLAGGYSYAYAHNSEGQILTNKSSGMNGGLTLSVPLFNGLNSVHALKIADLRLSTARSAFDYLRLQTDAKYYQAQRDLERTKTILALEDENIALADTNLSIALERFRVGQSTALEMRTAEQSYVDAATRLVTARYNAKQAETELLRLLGELVK
jgi:outer membrane protein TolC